MTRGLIWAWMFVVAFGAASPGRAAEVPATATGASFDPVAATEAYLDRLPAEQRERSDSYFEGGYWLQLWDFLYGLGVAALLLGTGLSARLRDMVERWTRFRFLQAVLYTVGYTLLVALLTFPLALYEGFFREHQYGLSNQSFVEWMGDQGKGMAVGLILGGLSVAALYAAFRRAPRTWWLWGAGLTISFLVLGILIAPVFIAPIFNRYTELSDPALRGSILSLARANGIPADHVYVFDASKQHNRVSANVSGLGQTMRISLNDNLLNRASPAGVEAVMGHEMGHYVLNHVYESIVFFGVVLFLGFAFLRWGFAWALARWGERWRVHGIADLAGLPLLGAVLSVYFFLLTPILNTYIRVNEAEADLFGLNSARQPDGFAEVSLMLSEYRKLAPGPIEEWIFFDHPSGRNRILMAMRWKAEQGKPTP
ncbi:MAG TPA: M48 family metallopeptidase [Thermoanaerobaculia bacterium]|nr:M48 family metallopeptidase [Thermoanaerobaculia bacterium]